jgi:signal transduction histidine kinase
VAASKLLVYRMLASPAQIRVTSGAALLFLAAFVWALLFPVYIARSALYFVPITSTMLIMADWITGLLLMSQARVLRARPLQFLAAGYFLSGLFLVLRLVSLLGIVIPADPTFDIPLWFYLASHAMLPLGVLGYVWLDRATDQPPAYRSRGRALAVSVVVAGCLVLAAAMAKTSLPWSSPTFLMACGVMVLTIPAMAMLGRALHSVLDLWLLLVLWGWLLEMALIALPSPGYTAAWYVGRSLGLVSGLFVLSALLMETSKFYAQIMLQLEQQNQDREHRSLIRDAITASIANELRQPLTSILINAQVGRKALGPDGSLSLPPGEMAGVLDDIVVQSNRANDIIKSTRTIFGPADPQEKSLADMGALAQGAMAMVAGDARARDIRTEFFVEGQPKPVAVHPLQMQQALMNLFQNAIDAMSASSRSPHPTLRVRCMAWSDPAGHPKDRGVILRIEDDGPGIAPADRERIFDVFYTTRPGGTGLGLAIARSVIEGHGGRLRVEPRIPMGSAFVIHLPYKDTAES